MKNNGEHDGFFGRSFLFFSSFVLNFSTSQLEYILKHTDFCLRRNYIVNHVSLIFTIKLTFFLCKLHRFIIRRVVVFLFICYRRNCHKCILAILSICLCLPVLRLLMDRFFLIRSSLYEQYTINAFRFVVLGN